MRRARENSRSNHRADPLLGPGFALVLPTLLQCRQESAQFYRSDAQVRKGFRLSSEVSRLIRGTGVTDNRVYLIPKPMAKLHSSCEEKNADTNRRETPPFREKAGGRGPVQEMTESQASAASGHAG